MLTIVGLRRALLISIVGMFACSADNHPDAQTRDGNGSRDASDIATDSPSCTGLSCSGACCLVGQLCRYDTCVDDLGRCTPGDASTPACPSDSYCDAMGFCTPYGVPADHDHDPTCTARQNPAPLVPFTQCTSTVGDMDGTPVVADLNFLPRNPDDTAAHPTIVVAVRLAAGSEYTSGGYLYLFDGSNCAIQSMLNDPSQVVAAAGTPAIGDLDMDGRPEIVAGSGSGGIIAFHYDMTTSRWTTLWHSDMSPGPFTAPAPAIADLGGDGHPEIVVGGYVYDWQGHLLDGTLGELPYQGYSTPVALADVDLDGITELIGNNGIYQLDATTHHLVRESYDTATTQQGFVAVADFGDFPGHAGDAPGRPEIVFFAAPTVIVRTIGGDTVFSANAGALAGGGPPAVADVDGDGKPEIIIAGHAMAAFDPDCIAGATRGGRCASSRTDGILWLQSGLQDGSSAINGCTAFDFDGDGRVEVVEADECFTRIFDGTTGDARWSAPRFSCTFIEMPIVADVNGDNAAEIVVPANNACSGSAVCGLAAGAPDPLLPGFECSADDGCPMGSHCVGHLCRCATAADCGPQNVCTAPPNGDGMGNVCRSSFDPSVGLKVYGDARHRWVPSRPVWNQYSYVVTNVDDHGVIPSAASVANNWQVRGLNNYRQNTQGALGDALAPDLTIAPSPAGCLPSTGGVLTLRARFCNRGTGIAGANSSVSFRAVGTDGGRTDLCTATAMTPVSAGHCVDVTCTAMFTPDATTSVEAVADANDQVLECNENDNARVIYRPGDCLP